MWEVQTGMKLIPYAKYDIYCTVYPTLNTCIVPNFTEISQEL
jgi:hypothetical protein